MKTHRFSQGVVPVTLGIAGISPGILGRNRAIVVDSAALLASLSPGYNLLTTSLIRAEITRISIFYEHFAPGASMSNRSNAVLRAFASALLITFVFSTLTYATTPDRISGPLAAGQAVTLRGGVHRLALPRYDQGRVDPLLRMGTVTLMTTPTASQQKALKALVAEQQDPKSPNYHKWLTPEQWADRFGLSRADVQKITAWLTAQGFHVEYVARGRNWVTFSGSAAQVERAFGIEIHRYNINGEMHVANASAPKIPAALAGIVTGLDGLHDFHLKPGIVKARPDFYDANLTPPNFLAPGDIATMYHINPLYTASTPIDGTGQKLAIIGQTDIFISDVNDFRNNFGLTPITGCTNDTTSGLVSACNVANFQYVLAIAADPLAPALSDMPEADLDLEWSGAVARNAQIIYVNAPVNGTGGGVHVAWFYAVDNNLAPVISSSYGLCEFGYAYDLTSTDEVELQKANTQGITFLNSSGDSGAAECDPNNNATNPDPTGASATLGYAVNYPASSPEVTAVGGTSISLANLASTTYWGTTSGTDGGSMLTPIPEQAWNDDSEFAAFCAANSTNLFCTQGGSTPVASWTPLTASTTAQTVQQDLALISSNGIKSGGGGPSNCATQDSTFSTCVSGFAQPSWQTVTITGQAAARFTPDVSLLASPNYPGYILCVAQEAWITSTSTASTCVNGISGTNSALDTYSSVVGGTSAATPVFAGIVTLLNQYLGTTGLANINPKLYSLAATPANLAFHQVTTGDNYVGCTAGTGIPGAPPCPASGPLGFTASAADATTGYNLVTGLGSVDVDNLFLAWAGVPQSFTVAASALNPTSLVAGHSTASTITVTPANGFSGTVTPTCSGLPTGALPCSFNPATLTSAGGYTSTLTISTPPTVAPSGPTTVTITGTSGALTGTTTVSLTVTATDQTFTLAPGTATYTVSQGGGTTATITVAGAHGFNTAMTYTCSVPSAATGATCTPPSGATAATSVSFQIATVAPSFALRQSPDRGSRIFYAVLLPGLLGIVLTVGSRKRSLRGMRLLGLIMVLGVSTMWLGSCGGSNNSSTKTGGTPKGSYTVTVNATTGGTVPITGSTTFTLTVQ